MDATPREILTMRVLDDEATLPDRVALQADPAAMAEVDALRGVGDLLRAALEPGEVDLADDVLAAIALEEDTLVRSSLIDALAPAGRVDLADLVMAEVDMLEVEAASGAAPLGWDEELLQEALAHHARVSLVDEVMATIEAAHPVLEELDAHHVALVDALSPEGEIDVADAVMAELASMDAPEGWEAAPLVVSLAPSIAIDVADAVMAALPPASVARPALQVIQGGGVPSRRARALRVTSWLGVVAAAAAALLVFVPDTTVDPASVAPVAVRAAVEPVALDASAPLAAVNDARVEALTTGAHVNAQVMQFEEGGPTIIMVEEVEL